AGVSGAQADDSRLAPLRNRSFRALLAYRICTILSYQIVAVTVGWHVYELTRDPWMLGLIGLAELVPYFCVAPFAGYLVDHLPRPGGRAARTGADRLGRGGRSAAALDLRRTGADRRRARLPRPGLQRTVRARAAAAAVRARRQPGQHRVPVGDGAGAGHRRRG